MLLVHHHRCLHVDVVGRGRSVGLLLTEPPRLHLLVLAPDALLDAIQDGLVMRLISLAIFRSHSCQRTRQLLREGERVASLVIAFVNVVKLFVKPLIVFLALKGQFRDMARVAKHVLSFIFQFL